jgi:hypothetical protein
MGARPSLGHGRTKDFAMTTLSSLPAVQPPDSHARVTARQAARVASTARSEVHAQDRIGVANDAKAAAKASDLASAKPVADVMGGLSTVAMFSAALSSMPASFGLAHRGASSPGHARPDGHGPPGATGLSAASAPAGQVVTSPGASSRNATSSERGRDGSGKDPGSQSQSAPRLETSAAAAGTSTSGDMTGSTFDVASLGTGAEASAQADPGAATGGASADASAHSTGADPALGTPAARDAGVAQFRQTLTVRRVLLSMLA